MDAGDGGNRDAGVGAAGEGRRPAAFEELMIAYQRMILGVAFRELGSKEDAKDAAQEVFWRLYRGLAEIDEARAVGAWLYRVTLNVCRDMRRRERRWVGLEEVRERTEERPDALSLLEDADRWEALRAGLERLPEKEQAAVLLRDIEGLSTAEVAEILGSSEATVRSQVSVARGKLRAFVGRVVGRRA